MCSYALYVYKIKPADWFFNLSPLCQPFNGKFAMLHYI